MGSGGTASVSQSVSQSGHSFLSADAAPHLGSAFLRTAPATTLQTAIFKTEFGLNRPAAADI